MKEKIVPLFRQSIAYSLGSLAGPLVGVFMVPIYTRIFAPEDYGVISLVQITIAFLGVFLILGTDNAGGRYYLDTKDERDKKLTASTALFFRSFTLITGSLVFIYFAKDISSLIFKTDSYSVYLIIAATALFFKQCGALFKNVLRFNFRTRTYAILSVASLIVTTSITILLVVSLKKGITGVFTAALISSVLIFVAQFLITRRYFSLSFSMKRLKELLQYGIPLVPYGITVYLIQNIDRYFLSYYSTLEQVGLYSIGFQLANLLALFFIGSGLAWGPFVFSTYQEGDIKLVYSKITNYLISATLFAVLGLSLFSSEVLMIFTTQQYYGASIVIPLLALYLAFYYLGLRMSMGTHIAKKTYHFTWISVVTAAINIGLNFLLVPPYGMIGAAASTLVSSIVWATLLISVSQRYYHINYNWGAFLKILVVTVAIISIYYLLLTDVSLQNILMKVGFLGIFIICLYFSGLIGKDEFKYVKNLTYKYLLRRNDDS